MTVIDIKIFPLFDSITESFEEEQAKPGLTEFSRVWAYNPYWQAKEINRVLNECDPQGSGINLSLLEHISPIEWDNVILYGEYVLNRDLIR